MEDHTKSRSTMDKQIITVGNTLLGKLKPGDHIISGRFGNQYEHHGIYIGQDADGVHKVTHVKGPIKDSNNISSSISCSSMQSTTIQKCTLCDYIPPENGGRVTSCLDCFSRGSKIRIVKYQVPLPDSNSYDGAEHGKILRGYRTNKPFLELHKGAEVLGHAAKVSIVGIKEQDSDVVLSKYFSSRTPEQVLEAARSNHYIGKYNFVFNNCEDFAVYCKTGKERSIQAENKLHIVPYKVGKAVHLLTTDRPKLKENFKEKCKEKALRFIGKYLDK